MSLNRLEEGRKNGFLNRWSSQSKCVDLLSEVALSFVLILSRHLYRMIHLFR